MFICIYEEKNSVQIIIFIYIKKKSESRNHLSEERNRQNQWQTYLSFATYLRRRENKKEKALEGKYREKPKYRNWRQSRKKKTKYNGMGKKREKVS